MHLISSNKKTRSEPSADIPILLFQHGTKRKFLSRPDSFEEMTRVVRRKFNLEDDVDISFEVEEFEVCKNGRVEVDESAYTAMAPYLDEMHVVTTPVVAKKQQRRSLVGASTSKGKGRELTRKESFLITPTTSIHEESTSQDRDEEPPRPSSSKLPEPAQEPEEDVDQLINEEAELMSATKTENKSVSLRSSTTTIKPEPSIPVKPASSSATASKLKNPRTAAPSSKPSSINVPTPSKAIATSSTSKLPNLQTSTPFKPASSTAASSASKPPSPRTFAPEPITRATTSRAQPSTSDDRRADELFNESVTVEDEIVFEESVFKPSPEQNRFFLGRQFNFGASGSGKDKAKQKETTKTSKPPVDDADIIDVDEEPDQRPVSSVTKALLGHSRTTTGDLEEQEERTVSVKTSKRIPSQAASPAKSTTKGARSRAATRELEVQTPAPTQGPVESPPDQDLIQPDGRFKVYIEGPKHKHRAEFMTKSRHTIKKVLAGACKTFNLNAQQARLEKVVIDEDDSDIETFEACQNNQTIGNAGIQPGAKLRVVVENYEEEDDDEEEELEEEDY